MIRPYIKPEDREIWLYVHIYFSKVGRCWDCAVYQRNRKDLMRVWNVGCYQDEETAKRHGADKLRELVAAGVRYDGEPA